MGPSDNFNMPVGSPHRLKMSPKLINEQVSPLWFSNLMRLDRYGSVERQAAYERLAERNYYDFSHADHESVFENTDAPVYQTFGAGHVRVGPSLADSAQDINDVEMMDSTQSGNTFCDDNGAQYWQNEPQVKNEIPMIDLTTPPTEQEQHSDRALIDLTSPPKTPAPKSRLKFESLIALRMLSPDSCSSYAISSIYSPIEVSKIDMPHKDEAVIDYLLAAKDESADHTYSIHRQKRLARQAEHEYSLADTNCAKAKQEWRRSAVLPQPEAEKRYLDAERKYLEAKNRCFQAEEDVRGLMKQDTNHRTHLDMTIRKEMDKIVYVLDSWKAANDLEILAAEMYLNGLKEKKHDLELASKYMRRFRDCDEDTDAFAVLEMLEGVKPLRK